MRVVPLVLVLLLSGCGKSTSVISTGPGDTAATAETLSQARQGFMTRVIRSGDSFGPPDQPTGRLFELIQYPSAVGDLAAYVSSDPGDGAKHPAIVWITGGDNNSIGDVWSPSGRDNDQSASGFRQKGIVMMFPSQRGGNDNPGKREGFYGEVDDILAATETLASLPYVDPDQIYLGGHSTGGTMALLVAESSDRYRGVFSLGPVAAANQYGGEFVYCDLGDEQEILLRSPLFWLHGIQTPTLVFEGARDGNWDAIEMMVEENSNPKVQFFRVAGHDHFSVIAPVVDLLAGQIVDGDVNVDSGMVNRLK